MGKRRGGAVWREVDVESIEERFDGRPDLAPLARRAAEYFNRLRLEIGRSDRQLAIEVTGSEGNRESILGWSTGRLMVPLYAVLWMEQQIPAERVERVRSDLGVGGQPSVDGVGQLENLEQRLSTIERWLEDRGPLLEQAMRRVAEGEPRMAQASQELTNAAQELAKSHRDFTNALATQPRGRRNS